MRLHWILPFLLGVLVGWICVAWELVEIKPEINFGEVLTLLVTVGAIVVVSKWWRDSQFSDDALRNHMNDISSDIRLLIPVMEEIIRRQNAGEIHRELVPKFRELSNLVYEIDQVSQNVCHQKIGGELQNSIFHWKRHVTAATPTVGFSPDYLQTSDVLLTVVRREISALKVKIYRTR